MLQKAIAACFLGCCLVNFVCLSNAQIIEIGDPVITRASFDASAKVLLVIDNINVSGLVLGFLAFTDSGAVPFDVILLEQNPTDKRLYTERFRKACVTGKLGGKMACMLDPGERFFAQNLAIGFINHRRTHNTIAYDFGAGAVSSTYRVQVNGTYFFRRDSFSVPVVYSLAAIVDSNATNIRRTVFDPRSWLYECEIPEALDPRTKCYNDSEPLIACSARRAYLRTGSLCSTLVYCHDAFTKPCRCSCGSDSFLADIPLMVTDRPTPATPWPVHLTSTTEGNFGNGTDTVNGTMRGVFSTNPTNNSTTLSNTFTTSMPMTSSEADLVGASSSSVSFSTNIVAKSTASHTAFTSTDEATSSATNDAPELAATNATGRFVASDSTTVLPTGLSRDDAAFSPTDQTVTNQQSSYNITTTVNVSRLQLLPVTTSGKSSGGRDTREPVTRSPIGAQKDSNGGGSSISIYWWVFVVVVVVVLLILFAATITVTIYCDKRRHFSPKVSPQDTPNQSEAEKGMSNGVEHQQTELPAKINQQQHDADSGMGSDRNYSGSREMLEKIEPVALPPIQLEQLRSVDEIVKLHDVIDETTEASTRFNTPDDSSGIKSRPGTAKRRTSEVRLVTGGSPAADSVPGVVKTTSNYSQTPGTGDLDSSSTTQLTQLIGGRLSPSGSDVEVTTMHMHETVVDDD